MSEKDIVVKERVGSNTNMNIDKYIYRIYIYISIYCRVMFISLASYC